MAERIPGHRYLAVKAALSGPAQDLGLRENALRARLLKQAGTVDTVNYAADLFENDEHRPVLDAFLLTRAPFDVISKTLGIPETVIDAYQYLFMDASVFRNKLEILSYAASYPGTPYGQELVRAAVSVGLDYLLWAYGNSQGELDARLVIRRTMVDAFFRGMAHKGNALTSNTAKESLKWWVSAIKNAELLERIDPHTNKAAAEELRIALTAKDDTLKPDESPVPLVEILH